MTWLWRQIKKKCDIASTSLYKKYVINASKRYLYLKRVYVIFTHFVYKQLLKYKCQLLYTYTEIWKKMDEPVENVSKYLSFKI